MTTNIDLMSAFSSQWNGNPRFATLQESVRQSATLETLMTLFAFRVDRNSQELPVLNHYLGWTCSQYNPQSDNNGWTVRVCDGSAASI